MNNSNSINVLLLLEICDMPTDALCWKLYNLCAEIDVDEYLTD